LFYVDLDNQIKPSDATISSATADSEDEELIIGSVTVVDEDTVISGEDDCDDITLVAGRSVVIELSGGTPSDEETTVTIDWVQSDGQEDSRDIRLLVAGRE